MKLVIADSKAGRTYQVEVAEDKRALITGKKIGDVVEGDPFGAAGYKLLLTGGSDTSGFPMRKDISGGRKLKTLVSGGTGFHPKRKGQRKKKVFRGDSYSPDITQVNAKVSEYGGVSLDELFGKKEEEKKE